MILSIWVYFLLGDPMASEHGTPYVQVEAPAIVHDSQPMREKLEDRCRRRFEADFPGHVVRDWGWRKQEVTVNKV